MSVFFILYLFTCNPNQCRFKVIFKQCSLENETIARVLYINMIYLMHQSWHKFPVSELYLVEKICRFLLVSFPKIFCSACNLFIISKFIYALFCLNPKNLLKI